MRKRKEVYTEFNGIQYRLSLGQRNSVIYVTPIDLPSGSVGKLPEDMTFKNLMPRGTFIVGMEIPLKYLSIYRGKLIDSDEYLYFISGRNSDIYGQSVLCSLWPKEMSYLLENSYYAKIRHVKEASDVYIHQAEALFAFERYEFSYPAENSIFYVDTLRSKPHITNTSWRNIFASKSLREYIIKTRKKYGLDIIEYPDLSLTKDATRIDLGPGTDVHLIKQGKMYELRDNISMATMRFTKRNICLDENLCFTLDCQASRHRRDKFIFSEKFKKWFHEFLMEITEKKRLKITI